jgi:hypothetical protein
VRSLRLAKCRYFEAWVFLDFGGHGFDPPVAIVVARVRILRPVAGDESFDLAIHLHVPGHALEEMAPRVVRLHADRDTEPVHPFSDPFGDFLELRIAGLAATAAIRIIEEWLVQLLASWT